MLSDLITFQLLSTVVVASCVVQHTVDEVMGLQQVHRNLSKSKSLAKNNQFKLVLLICPKSDQILSQRPADESRCFQNIWAPRVSYEVRRVRCEASTELLTGVGEVEGSEEGVVVFGRHSGVRRVEQDAIGSQQLLHLLLQLLFLLDEGGRGFGAVGLLDDGQH